VTQRSDQPRRLVDVLAASRLQPSSRGIVVRPSLLRTRVTTIVAAAALVLAACGGDDTPETEAPADDQEVDDTEVDDEPDDADDADADDGTDDADDGTDEADDQTDGDAAGDEVDPDEALAIARGFDDDLVASIVTYEMSGVDELGSGVLMRIGQDPPSTVATRIESPDGDIISIVDVDSGETVVCFGQAGDFECFSDDSMFGDDLFDDLPGQGLELEDEDAPDRAYRTEILGLQALCLVYDDLDGVTDVELCIAEDEGLLLRYAGTDPDLGAQVRLEAVDIADADPAFFEPPSEPISFGDLEG
jgi:hypothetical protein